MSFVITNGNCTGTVRVGVVRYSVYLEHDMMILVCHELLICYLYCGHDSL